MAYITANELKAVVPDKYRDAALSDEGNVPVPGLLSSVIETASNEVDALIEGRVLLPVSRPPKKLKIAALYIALEILFIRKGVDLPESTARKITFYRNWLSKIGAGDLRLEAPAVDAPEAIPGGSISTTPSLTGTGGLITGFLLLLSCLARPVQAIDARTYSFVATTNPLIEAPDFLEWSQAESVGLRYSLPSSDSKEARWEISDRTNLWLNMAPAKSGTTWSWNPAPTQTCLPAGRYQGRVAVYTRDAQTNLIFHRVVAWQDIRVHAARDPRTLVFASPLESTSAGYLTAETDAAALGVIAAMPTSLWSTAYGWGDHGAAGYATTGAVATAVAPLASTDHVALAIAAIPAPDLTPYATTSAVAAAVAPLASTDHVALAIAAIPAPDLTPYATTGAVAAAVAPLASTTHVAQAIADETAARTNAGYLTDEADPTFTTWEPTAHVPVSCAGGYYFPNYFTLDPVPTYLNFVDYGTTNEQNSVFWQWRTSTTEAGYRLTPEITRQVVFDDTVEYSDLLNLSITNDADGTAALWVDGTPTGTVGSLTATLGDYSVNCEVVRGPLAAVKSNAYWVADVSGSLRHAINSNVTAAAGAAGVNGYMYSGGQYTASNVFIRSATFWAKDFDLTCASPWNNYCYTNSEGAVHNPSGNFHAGTAITKQHIAYARHYTAPTGTVFRFIDATNGIHNRTLVKQRLLDWDIAIGLLDSPLPDQITPATILRPSDKGYLFGKSSLYGAPGLKIIALDQAERAWVMASYFAEGESYFFETKILYFGGTPTEPFGRQGGIGGDSGNPLFLICGTNTTLLSTFHSSSMGPSYPANRDAIEAAMADMVGSVYTNLPSPDLSAWPNYQGGATPPEL